MELRIVEQCELLNLSEQPGRNPRFFYAQCGPKLPRICLGAGYLSRMAGDTLPSLPGPTDTGGTLSSSASTWEGPSLLISLKKAHWSGQGRSSAPPGF